MRWLLSALLLLVSWGVTEFAWAECRVLSANPTYTAGQLKDLTCGTNGALSVGGGVGSATSAAPTFTEGSAGSFSFDLAGNVRVTPGTLAAGEDLTATGAFAGGVMVVEQRYVASGLKTADFQVKASAGFLHCVIVMPNDGAPTAGQVDMYDSLTETGTKLFHAEITTTFFNPYQICPDVAAATGIYLGFTTTADVNVQVTYR